MVADKNKITAIAQKYTAKGQFEKAIAELRKIVKEDPADIRTWLKMGDLFTRMGSRKDATDTYLRVADHYKKSGFHLKAVAVYKQVIKLDPMLADVYDLLAESYLSLGLTSEALIQLEQLVDMFQRASNSERMLATLQRMADLDPQNISTRLRIAEQLSKEGRGEEAVRRFSEACDLLKQQGRTDDFLKVAERLLFHDASQIAVAREAAAIYLEKNHPKRALAKLQLCFAKEPRNVDTLDLLAQSFNALGQPDKAVSVYHEIAVILGEQNREADRRRIYEKILALDPENAAARAAIGRGPRTSVAPSPQAQPQLPSPAAAISGAAAPPAAEEAPEEELTEEALAAKAEKLIGEAEVLVKYGLIDRAREHFNKIFEFDFYNLDARERLKDFLLQHGDRAGALEQLFILADGFLEEQPEGAVYFLHQILAIDPRNRKARDILHTIGGVMPEGLPDLAEESEAVELVPTAEATAAVREQPEPPTAEPGPTEGAGEAEEVEEVIVIDDEGEDEFEVVGKPTPRVEPMAPMPEMPETELPDIDGEIEEIDFFVSQGLVDEALPILNDLAARYPDDPRVQRLLAEMGDGDAIEPAGSDKPTAPPPARMFDIDVLTGDLDLEDITDDDVNNEIDKVFSQFKAGVEKQVSRSDYATHYDLGVAYREMGLHEDAIAEFRIASGDPKREATAMTMIGVCQSLLGRPDEALVTFRCELEKKDLEESARLALMYEIAKVYEAQGRRDEALATYNSILQVDPGFADVVDRIDAMGL